MRNLLIIATTLMLIACGAANRASASLTGYSETCIDGVLYYQFPSGVTVAYSADGKVKACKK